MIIESVDDYGKTRKIITITISTEQMSSEEIHTDNFSRQGIPAEQPACLVLSKRACTAARLAPGKELTDTEFLELIAVMRKECLQHAGKLLQSRDYSERRLYEKLAERMYPERICEAVIEDLKAAKYLDDERFARQFISYHMKDRSLSRIRMDLQKKGISPELADAVLEEFRGEEAAEEELLQIRKYMEKKHFDASSADWNEKQKMMAFLYRKGYSSERIREAIRLDS